MSAATQSSPAQRLPAWKRLGLKLKGPASTDSPSAASAPTRPPASHAISADHATDGVSSPGNWTKKRKQYPFGHSNNSTDDGHYKRARIGFSGDQETPNRRKSVTFADGTKGSDHDPSATKTPSRPQAASTTESSTDPNKKSRPKKVKAKKPAKKPEQNFKPTHLQPQLSQYLRDWQTSRGTWKFRKNIQTLLIKYAFEPELLPTADINIFNAYAKDLKGASRTWLRDSAAEIRKKDTEEGASAFLEGTAEEKQIKQRAYEDILTKAMGRNTTAPASASNANGKRPRSYDEEDYVMGGTEATAGPRAATDVTQRLVKRMRAEMVLEELSSIESSDSSASTSGSTASKTEAGSEASTKVSSQEAATAAAAAAAADGTGAGAEKKLKLNDGSQRRASRSRKRRTVNGDDDSSSSSGESGDDESEGEEDAGDADDGEEDDEDAEESTSSSGGSSDSESDSSEDGSESEGALRRLGEIREELETSSSSSSSSSSESSGFGGESESDDDVEL